ncbi:MAG: hypothetical protein HDT28_04410 [Clostridiales bacterium]|nr:hypothetical protein [Clostridiales bacterium]
MKTENKFKLIVFLPIVIGIALLIIGMVTGSSIMTYAGIAVLFGGSFLVAMITAIVVIVRAVRGSGTSDTSSSTSSSVDDDTDIDDEIDDDIDDEDIDEEDIDEEDIGIVKDEAVKEKSGSDKEREMIEKINSTRGEANKMANAEYQLSHAAKTWKGASRGDKVKGCLFVICFISCLFGAMILFGLGYNLAGGIVFGCAFLIIFGALIITKIIEHRSMSGNYDRADYDRKTGIVKNCTLSSSVGAGSGSTSRISSIVYRVQVEVDGKLRNAYSREYYDEGDKVKLLVHKRLDTVKIIDDGEDEPLDDYEIMRDEANARMEELQKRAEEYEKRWGLPDDPKEPEPKKADADVTAAREELAVVLSAMAKREDEAGDTGEPEKTPEPTAPEKKEEGPIEAVESKDEKVEPTEPRPSTRRPNTGYKGIKRN